MENKKVLISFDIKQVLELEGTLEELESMCVQDLVDRLTDEECRSLLYANVDSFRFEHYTVETIVRRVINEYDPYGIMPGSDGGPDNEYDPESKEIAEKIDLAMSVKEIAGVIKETFMYFFDEDRPLERYYRPAEEIHKQLARLKST